MLGWPNPHGIRRSEADQSEQCVTLIIWRFICHVPGGGGGGIIYRRRQLLQGGGINTHRRRHQHLPQEEEANNRHHHHTSRGAITHTLREGFYQFSDRLRVMLTLTHRLCYWESRVQSTTPHTTVALEVQQGPPTSVNLRAAHPSWKEKSVLTIRRVQNPTRGRLDQRSRPFIQS